MGFSVYYVDWSIYNRNGGTLGVKVLNVSGHERLEEEQVEMS